MIEDTPVNSREGENNGASWSGDKYQQLVAFMDDWGDSMGQYYEDYNLNQTISMYGISFPDEVIDLLSVNDVAVNAEWVEYAPLDPESDFYVVAAFTDKQYITDNIEGYQFPHFYLFGFDLEGTPMVIHSQQNQGMPDGLIHFYSTENAALQAGFEEIAYSSWD